MNRARALDQLCRALQGRTVERAEWTGVIELANLALITPRLAACLDSADAPADVRVFVGDVARRNAERNDRLFNQMGEAASALNAVGVVPLVLKGGARLARTGGRSSRVTNDIDLVVRPDQVQAALIALEAAGFVILSQRSGAALHAVAELGRPQDVGMIDLHQRPPGPPGFVSGPEFQSDGRVLSVGVGQVRAPDPYMHIYLQALHDQLHDGGYWRGGFDLRHAWDIADLIAEGEVDWSRLAQLPPSRLTSHAVEAQLMACHRLTGSVIPQATQGWDARLRERRQRLQYTAPSWTLPLAALAIVSEVPNLLEHRRQDRLGRANAGLPPADDSLPLSFARLQRLLSEQRDGRL